MTNFEKFKDEIIDLTKNNKYFSVVEGRPENCHVTNCKRCLFINDINCRRKRIFWLYEEYHEPIKLTAKEKAFLSIVETGWIARDAAGVLNWYQEKPRRGELTFQTLNTKVIYISEHFALFSFIKWEDEPYSIEEMLTWEVEE